MPFSIAMRLELPLDWAAVKRDDQKLFVAAKKWFHRWSLALTFAGFSPVKPGDGPQ